MFFPLNHIVFQWVKSNVGHPAADSTPEVCFRKGIESLGNHNPD
jgi:hypothetical protein